MQQHILRQLNSSLLLGYYVDKTRCSVPIIADESSSVSSFSNSDDCQVFDREDAGFMNQLNAQSGKNDVMGRFGELSGCVMMPIDEAVKKIESFISEPLQSIPDGNKSNMFYMIDNTRNAKTKGPKLYRDDCGAWRGSSHKLLYKRQGNGPFKRVVLINKKFCIYKSNTDPNKSSKVYPIEPQPNDEDIISVYKYNTYFKAKRNCKRRVVVCSSKPAVALVEYSGNFADPREPHGVTKFVETCVPYIRTDPKVMEFVKERRINKTNLIMAETFSSFGMSSIRDRKVISNAKEREIAKSSPFSKPAPKNIADELQEVIREANSSSNYYIQNVCINKDGAIIYLYTKETLQYMKNACVTSRKKSIIVVDKTYNLCGLYVTVTTFKFAGVV